MGKKAKPGKKGGDAAVDEDKGERKLQAILLADSFTKTFRPVTWQNPKVLLPLVNVPMLDYTIEFLSQNGVEEIFVFCVWHAEELQRYINSSKWFSTLIVRCISSTACLSAGDALRELDSMGIVRSDPFILISGDVISNMDLKKAILFHKEKRKIDSNAIMTVVLKPVQRTAGAKAVMDDLVVGLDKKTSQIIFFEDEIRKGDIRFPLEIMAEHPCLSFRTDLLDCHVDICSPELLMQFSDNFDYQNIRRHFIRNEVVNWELGMHLYSYILQNEYAARVHDPRTYHSICRDIVSRWVYPLVPDAQLLPDGSFTHSRRFVYREDGVRVSRSAQIGEGVVIGSGSVIGAGVVLNRTVIGRNCIIGDNALITDSHLWTGVTVEENAVIRKSILCDRVIIKHHAAVPRGCVLSYGVVVGHNITLPEFTRVSGIVKTFDEFDGVDTVVTERSTSSPPYDTSVLGEDGVGYVWVYEGGGDYDVDEDDDEEDEDSEGGTREAVNLMIASSAGCIEEESWKSKLWDRVPLPVDSSDDEDDEGTGEGDEDEDYQSSSRNDNAGASDGYSEETITAGNPPTIMKDKSSSSAAVKKPLPAAGSGFKNVVADMILSGYKDGHEPANLLMEIKGYKFAQNKDFSDCIEAVVPSLLLLSLPAHAPVTTTAPAGSTPTPTPALTQAIAVKGFTKMFGSSESGAGGWGHSILKALLQTEDDQMVLIEVLERLMIEETATATAPSVKTVLHSSFRYFLQSLYDSEKLFVETTNIIITETTATAHVVNTIDLLSEEVLLDWISKREKGEAETVRHSSSSQSGEQQPSINAKQQEEILALFHRPDVQAFVDWLKEDDDEDDDSEEGDED